VDTSTPVLEARSTADSTRQANVELDTSPTEPYKVRTELQEGASSSNRTEDGWVTVRRKKGKPWRGHLPPPRQSPRRMLGDVLANAKILDRRKS
jgi:hypothetical protein